jgi:hypothetical protein
MCAYVEKYNFSHQGRNYEHEEKIQEPLVELRLSVCLGHNRRTQTLRRDNAEASNETAYAQIYHHTFLSVPRCYPYSNEDTGDDDDSSVCQKPRRDDKMLHLLYIGDGTLRRGVHNDDHGAHYTHEATHFSNEA